MHGFDIIESESVNSVISVEHENYTSVTVLEFRDKVEEKNTEELLEGNYIIVQDKPRIVSALDS